MRHITLFFFVLLCTINAAFAGDGDTTIVQTFTFADGKGGKTGTFQFPDGNVKYSKILMLYTVTCDPNATDGWPCGEWDYEFFTRILVPTDTNVTPIIDSDTIIGYDTVVNYVHYLLQCYVSPYGGGLAPILGDDGFTYVLDVSDYVHLLRNSVILESTNGQELVDIKFMFIEGTPARNVIDLKSVWYVMGRQAPYNSFETVIRDTTIALQANEKMVNLRAMLTGHGFNNPGGNDCAEFCHNIHSLKSNNQEIEAWDIIQPCSETPLSPQGGTWAFARAGWCPGMPATIREFNLTPHINNDSINFDYDVTYDDHGSLNVDIQLITYDSMNFQTDVSIIDIISPSTNPMNNRYNPSWKNAIIKIKNIGANILTDVDINYSYDNHQYSYHWTGSLKSMREILVELPKPNFDSIGGSEATGIFYADVLNPNGATDPTPYNNHSSSSYKLPPLYDVNNFRVNYRSPVNPTRTKWYIYNEAGAVVVKSDNQMAAGETYNKEFTLQDGSYMFEIQNLDGCGLYNGWYGGTGQGNARLQHINEGGTNYNITCHSVPVLFGYSNRFYFAVKSFTSVGIDQSQENMAQITMYSNPASEKLNLDLTQIATGKVSAVITDATGKQVPAQSLIAGQINTIDISNLPNGIYVIEVFDGGKQIWKHKLIIEQ
jgi:hypothetical protein